MAIGWPRLGEVEWEAHRFLLEAAHPAPSAHTVDLMLAYWAIAVGTRGARGGYLTTTNPSLAQVLDGTARHNLGRHTQRDGVRDLVVRMAMEKGWTTEYKAVPAWPLEDPSVCQDMATSVATRVCPLGPGVSPGGMTVPVSYTHLTLPTNREV